MCPHINGPLTRYVKFRVAHAPGMPGKFLPRHRLQRNPVFSDPGMHGGTCVTHVPRCLLGSLTRGGGEKDPGIPGACTTHTLTYLLRGPWKGYIIIAYILKSSKTKYRVRNICTEMKKNIINMHPRILNSDLCLYTTNLSCRQNSHIRTHTHKTTTTKSKNKQTKKTKKNKLTTRMDFWRKQDLYSIFKWLSAKL